MPLNIRKHRSQNLLACRLCYRSENPFDDENMLLLGVRLEEKRNIPLFVKFCLLIFHMSKRPSCVGPGVLYGNKNMEKLVKLK